MQNNVADFSDTNIKESATCASTSAGKLVRGKCVDVAHASLCSCGSLRSVCHASCSHDPMLSPALVALHHRVPAARRCLGLAKCDVLADAQFRVRWEPNAALGAACSDSELDHVCAHHTAHLPLGGVVDDDALLMLCMLLWCLSTLSPSPQGMCESSFASGGGLDTCDVTKRSRLLVVATCYGALPHTATATLARHFQAKECVCLRGVAETSIAIMGRRVSRRSIAVAIAYLDLVRHVSSADRPRRRCLTCHCAHADAAARGSLPHRGAVDQRAREVVGSKLQPADSR